MNQSLLSLIEGMRRSLGEVVQPELASDHARSQLAGTIDVLGKLERMLAWSPDVLIDQLSLLREGCDAFAARAAEAGAQVPTLAPVPPRPLRQSELEQAVRDGGTLLATHIDWLLDPATPIDARARGALDALLRSILRGQLQAERNLIPRADFGAMTAGAQRTAN